MKSFRFLRPVLFLNIHQEILKYLDIKARMMRKGLSKAKQTDFKAMLLFPRKNEKKYYVIFIQK